jgi:ribosomal protein L11 methyltransferase
VSVRVAAERGEEARAVLIDLFPEGFEEVDVEGGIEFAAYTNAGGEERLWQVFGPGSAREVEAGWGEAWKNFHRPLRVGGLWVGPPWETPDEGSLAVVIDPGRAFGTGAHPTTRLCLELLVAHEPASLLDVGCGSGVLAIAAARLGYSPVTAVDADEAAVEATRANAEMNGVTVDVDLVDALESDLAAADLVVANIALGPVERLAGRLESPELVTSGYLVSDEPALPGWERAERRDLDGWVADRYVRRSRQVG